MKKFVRGIYILWVVFRYGLDQIVLVNLQRPGIRLLARTLSVGRRFDAPRGQRLREALERLGPIFVKFGQVLSTRRDLLPADIADELAKLQDQVPPFDPAIAVATIEDSLQRPLDEVFADFTMEPVASASIAQVHFATLRDRSGGLQEVAVKVLRPGMLPVIEQDLALMRILAGWVTRLSADGRRLRPLDVVDEFDRYLHDELDLVREAANAAQLRRNMEKAGCKVLIPGMFWDWCRADVLVMERMHGVPVNDMAQLRAAGINLPQLAADGLNIFFTQVFRDGFFHADMHPGNIRVSLAPQTFGWYILLDFGIVGMLTGFDKEYLARNFAAFFRRDYRGVAQLHIDSGWVPPETRVEELEAAVRTVCEPYFDRPLRDISLGMVLMRLFQMSRRFQVSIQPQLVMLQKTMLNVEGLGRQLDPDLDLWRTAKPFLEKWMSEQIGLRHLVQRLRTEASTYADVFPELPRLLHSYLQRREDHSRRKMLEELLRTQRHTHQLLQSLLYICLGFVGAMALALLYFRHLA